MTKQHLKLPKVKIEKTINNGVNNNMNINKKQDYVNRLNLLCQQAIAEGNLRCALQAEKMIGDANGYFQKKKQNILDLKEFSDDDVNLLINQLKERHQNKR